MFAADTILPQNSGFSFIITTSIWIDIYKCVCVHQNKHEHSSWIDIYKCVCVCVCVCVCTHQNKLGHSKELWGIHTSCLLGIVKQVILLKT